MSMITGNDCRRLAPLFASVIIAAGDGCVRKQEVTQPVAAPAHPSKSIEPTEPEGIVTLDVEGKPLALTHGRAEWFRGQIFITLTKDDFSCAAPGISMFSPIADQLKPNSWLRFSIAAGPNGEFYGGEEIDKSVSVGASHPELKAYTRRARVTMDALAPKKGAHLRGAIRIPRAYATVTPEEATSKPRTFSLSGHGRFDVTLCNEDDEHWAIPLPDVAPETPLSLDMDGKPVSLARGFALVTADPEGAYYSLVFPTAPAKCVDGALVLTTKDKLEIDSIGRSSKEDLMTGIREPASARYVAPDGADSASNAWVRLHDVSPTKLKGELVARTTKRSGIRVLTAGGRFEATICGSW